MRRELIFIWESRNEEHIAMHGVTKSEAEYVASGAKGIYPRNIGGGKLLVHGPTRTGRWLQVIYVLRDADTIDVTRLSFEEQAAVNRGVRGVYVVHARDLTIHQRRRSRRNTDR